MKSKLLFNTQKSVMKFKTTLICLFLFGCTTPSGLDLSNSSGKSFTEEEVSCGSIQDVQQKSISLNLTDLFKGKDFSLDTLEQYISLPYDFKQIDNNKFYYFGESCRVTVQTKDEIIQKFSTEQVTDNGCVNLGRKLIRDIGKYSWEINTFSFTGCVVMKSQRK